MRVSGLLEAVARLLPRSILVCQRRDQGLAALAASVAAPSTTPTNKSLRACVASTSIFGSTLSGLRLSWVGTRLDSPMMRRSGHQRSA